MRGFFAGFEKRADFLRPGIGNKLKALGSKIGIPLRHKHTLSPEMAKMLEDKLKVADKLPKLLAASAAIAGASNAVSSKLIDKAMERNQR